MAIIHRFIFLEERSLAEKRGFEPLTRCREHAFQAGALNHSATSPVSLYISLYRKKSPRSNILLQNNIFLNIMHIGADVAQLVEQHIRNVWVGGSSPFLGTIFVLLVED
jgi:hypothetical protein